MTKNEQQMYSDVTSIRESLKKIANALETNVPTTPKSKDMPGFEGTLDALDCLTSDFKNKAFLHEQSLAPTSSNNDDDRYEVDGSSVGDGKYEDDHNDDIVVPCSAELDNQMYNESI